MARRFDKGRMISRSFFTSGDLVDQPAWVRLLWAGLIVYADNSGLIRDNEVLFRGTLLAGLGIRLDKLRSAIGLLEDRHMLSTCFVKGIKYYQITNFKDGQRLKDAQSSIEREREKERERERERERGQCAPQVEVKPPPPDPEPPPSKPIPVPRPAQPSAAFQESAEFLNFELCAKPDVALEALRRLALDEAGHREYVRSFREALRMVRDRGEVSDPRAYVRSRALRFRTAAEADLESAVLSPEERKAKREREALHKLGEKVWKEAENQCGQTSSGRTSSTPSTGSGLGTSRRTPGSSSRSGGPPS